MAEGLTCGALFSWGGTDTMTDITAAELLGYCSDALRAAVKKLEHAEVYAEVIEQKKVSITSGQLSSVQQIERQGMGIRMFVQGKMAFASVNALSGERLYSALEKSAQLAACSPFTSVLPHQTALPEINLYDRSMVDVPLEEVAEYAQHLLDSAKACDRRIHLESGMVVVTTHTRALANSRSVEASEASTTAVWELLGVARDHGCVSDFDHQCEGTHVCSRIQVEHAVERLAESVVPALKARTCRNFHGEIIFGPGAVSTIVSSIAQAINARDVEKGISILGDSLHTTVVSPLVTLKDDALLPDGLASASFDREGVPHCTLPVIEKGVLTSFLHDTATASHAHTHSTGHTAGGYRSRPEIEPTNLLIETGDHTLDELLGDVNHGLFITRLSGTPSPTGEFSFAVKNAVTIDRGELKTPVKGLMISGNLYTLLKEVTGISKTSFPLGDGHYPFVKVSPQILVGS